MGKTVTVEVDTAHYPQEEWEVDVMIKGDKLSFVSGAYGRADFRAMSSGNEKVKAVLLNRKTLQFAGTDIEIAVEP